MALVHCSEIRLNQHKSQIELIFLFSNFLFLVYRRNVGETQNFRKNLEVNDVMQMLKNILIFWLRYV